MRLGETRRGVAVHQRPAGKQFSDDASNRQHIIALRIVDKPRAFVFFKWSSFHQVKHQGDVVEEVLIPRWSTFLRTSAG